MNDLLIVTSFVLLDDLMLLHGHRTDVRAAASDSEVLTVAVIAACQFGNHHERALCVLRALGYLSGALSVSRFNRRLHTLADWLTLALDLLCERFAGATTAFTLDSLPVPVCKCVRAMRCRKVQGAAFYGWRLHLVCTEAGVPFGWYAAREFARPEPRL